MRILLVDDDLSVRAYVAELLQYQGADVVFSDSLDGAVAKLADRNIQIDGVVADMIIIGGNGIDVAKAAAIVGVRTVFSSSVDDEYNINLMLEHGWIVPKPMRMTGAKRIVDYFKGAL